LIRRCRHISLCSLWDLWTSLKLLIFFFYLSHVSLNLSVIWEILFISKIRIYRNVLWSRVSCRHESSMHHLWFTASRLLFMFPANNISWKIFPVNVFSFSNRFLMTFMKTLVKNSIKLYISSLLVKIQLKIHAFTIKVKSLFVLVKLLHCFFALIQEVKMVYRTTAKVWFNFIY
jgi:hypothetical protein